MAQTMKQFYFVITSRYGVIQAIECREWEYILTNKIRLRYAPYVKHPVRLTRYATPVTAYTKTLLDRDLKRVNG